MGHHCQLVSIFGKSRPGLTFFFHQVQDLRKSLILSNLQFPRLKNEDDNSINFQMYSNMKLNGIKTINIVPGEQQGFIWLSTYSHLLRSKSQVIFKAIYKYPALKQKSLGLVQVDLMSQKLQVLTEAALVLYKPAMPIGTQIKITSCWILGTCLDRS